jgi:hypothetical protein
MNKGETISPENFNDFGNQPNQDQHTDFKNEQEPETITPGNDSAEVETDKEETPLSYDEIFQRSIEQAGVENPVSMFNSIVWRFHAQEIREGKITKQEMFHEAVVGGYLALEEGVNNFPDFYKATANHCARFANALRSRGTYPASDYENESLGANDVLERAAYKINPESNIDEFLEESWQQSLFTTAREFILANEKRKGQGERDLEVFVRYLTGQTSAEIVNTCKWLKSADSVDQAIVRIIAHLRECFDGAIGDTVAIRGKHKGRGGRKFEHQRSDYFKNYYQNNLDRLREINRERIRAKRAVAKEAKTNDENNQNNASNENV